jgi:hypothetical protein
MLDDKALLYIVIAMVVVSFSGTYDITHKILGKFGLSSSQEEYGMGMKFTNGFLLHIAVFAGILLVLRKYNLV